MTAKAPVATEISRNDTETTVLSWQVHPLRERPQAIPVVAGAYALAFLLWRFLFPHPLALSVPTLGLTVALSEFLFPTHFRLTRKGAYANCFVSRLFIDWSDVRRATTGADGVYLSPFSRASRLDNFRGIRLRFADGNAEVVRETVRALRSAQEAETNPE